MTLQQGSDKVSIDFPPNMILESKFEEEQGRRLKKSLEIELGRIMGEEEGGTGGDHDHMRPACWSEAGRSPGEDLITTGLFWFGF